MRSHGRSCITLQWRIQRRAQPPPPLHKFDPFSYRDISKQTLKYVRIQYYQGPWGPDLRKALASSGALSQSFTFNRLLPPTPVQKFLDSPFKCLYVSDYLKINRVKYHGSKYRCQVDCCFLFYMPGISTYRSIKSTLRRFLPEIALTNNHILDR